MSLIRVGTAAFPISPNPASGKFYIGLDSTNSNRLSIQNDAGVVTDIQSGASYTDEDAQDAVGAMVANGQGVNLTYVDGVPSLTPDLNINGLTELTTTNDIQEDDFIVLYDTSATAHRKVKRLKLEQVSPDRIVALKSDYLGGSVAGADLTATVAGTGASAQAGTYGVDLTEKAQGVLQIDTGTTATGRAGLGSAVVTHMFMPTSNDCRMYFGARIACESVSTSLETFVAYIGFQDAHVVAGDATDGCYFRYTDAVNGGRWEAVVAQGATRLAADTGVPLSLNYQVFEIDFTNGQALFYIDGVLTNTVTTNLPAGPTQAFGFGWKIEKTVGTGQRNMSADWHEVVIEYTGAR